MFGFLKNIGKKKAKVAKEEFEAVKRGVLEVVSKDAEGNRLFNPEKYNEMCEIKYSAEGVPEDIIVTVKKIVGGEIVCEKLSMRENHGNPNIHELLIESARLGDSDLFFDKVKSAGINEESSNSKMVPIDKTDGVGYSTGVKLRSEIETDVVSSKSIIKYKN